MEKGSRGVVVGALISFFLLAGCGSPQHRFRMAEPPPSGSSGKIPLTLALVLPPATCSYTRVVGDIQQSVFHVGETVCRNVREAARRVYGTVTVVDKASAVSETGADAVLEVRILSLDGYVERKIPAIVGYRMPIGWSFSTRDGKSVYYRRLVAAGEDQRTYGYVDPRHLASLQRCLDDLGRKAAAEMADSLENGRKNLSAEEDILSKLGKYAPGVTSLDAYEKDKTDDWKVTIRERATRSRKIVSDDGKTTSLPETEVYVKDEVRSAYGDDLVCSVEFAGKGKDGRSVRLTALECRRDTGPVLCR